MNSTQKDTDCVWQRTITERLADFLLQEFWIYANLKLGTSEATMRKVELDRSVEQRSRTSTTQVNAWVSEVMFGKMFLPAGFDQSFVVRV